MYCIDNKSMTCHAFFFFDGTKEGREGDWAFSPLQLELGNQYTKGGGVRIVPVALFVHG